MDSAAPGFRALVLLALQASVFGTVFGFGLDTTLQDMLWVLRRPRLLMRSIVAMFVIMPAVAIALATLFDFLHVVEVALVALSISPVPPLLPRRQGQSGARGPYALGLMAWLALLSIGLVPGALEVVERFAKQPLEMDPLAVARTVVGTALAPLAAGMIIRSLAPAAAARFGAIVNRVALVVLALGIVALLTANLPAMWALLGNGTLVAMTTFIATALAVGHVLGGPEPDHSIVLALSNACRHPAIALSIASTNLPNKQFGATVLLYVVMNFMLCIPYILWQRRRLPVA